MPFSIAGTVEHGTHRDTHRPTSGQSFPAGSAVTLSANATDPGGAVIRVEFRVDGALVSSDTTSPYSFNATGLAAGSHTVTATAFDNGNPTLSTVTPAVPFTARRHGRGVPRQSAGPHHQERHGVPGALRLLVRTRRTA